jgi:membrane-associated PAP2 superfamily phosphatase
MMHPKVRVLRAVPNVALRLTLFQRKAFYALVLTGLLLLILMRFPYLDVALADIYFDADQQIFPLKNTWFAKTLMHEYVKLCLQYVGLALCVAVLSDIVQPWFSNAWLRVRLRFVALSAVSIPLVITLLKRISVLHCPWDIDRYGGVYPYIAMFDPLPAHMIAGHCFPAGHATSGLWLAACAVFWWPHQPNIAGRVFAIGLMVGFVLGWVQQMRGAHFLSHTLMSVWLACCILLILYVLTPALTKRDDHMAKCTSV